MQIDEVALYRMLGGRVRERRVQAGLTQAELAEAAGLLRTTITNIEAANQRIPLHVLYAIADVLGLEPAALLPARAEVIGPGVVPVEVAGVVRAIPPKAAAFLHELMTDDTLAGRENADFASDKGEDR